MAQESSELPSRLQSRWDGWVRTHCRVLLCLLALSLAPSSEEVGSLRNVQVACLDSGFQSRFGTPSIASTSAWSPIDVVLVLWLLMAYQQLCWLNSTVAGTSHQPGGSADIPATSLPQPPFTLRVALIKTSKVC